MHQCRLTSGIWMRGVFILARPLLLLFVVSSVLRVMLTVLWIASGRRRKLKSGNHRMSCSLGYMFNLVSSSKLANSWIFHISQIPYQYYWCRQNLLPFVDSFEFCGYLSNHFGPFLLCSSVT